jgi:hypothetical protein
VCASYVTSRRAVDARQAELTNLKRSCRGHPHDDGDRWRLGGAAGDGQPYIVVPESIVVDYDQRARRDLRENCGELALSRVRGAVRYAEAPALSPASTRRTNAAARCARGVVESKGTGAKA